MPLLGPACMLLNFDVATEAIPEHDHWHTHEHLQERLSIPGFLRGTRWIATRGGPRYMAIYEVASLATLTSPAYLERLNSPSPWTQKMMPHYRGMTRGFCRVAGSFGIGLGNAALLLRFTPEPGKEDRLRKWLTEEVLPALATQPGLGSVHLLEGAVAPAMTNEQRIRGADAGVDWALVLTGYDSGALEALPATNLAGLESRGATGITNSAYRLDYVLTEREARPNPA